MAAGEKEPATVPGIPFLQTKMESPAGMERAAEEYRRFSHSGDVLFNQPVALSHSKRKVYRERKRRHQKKVKISQNYKNTHFRTGARGTLQTVIRSCTEKYSTNWEKINQLAHPTLNYIMAKGTLQLIKKVYKLGNIKKLRKLKTAAPGEEKTIPVVMITFKYLKAYDI
ncbi:hypothetical protein AAY473_017706 [Plecturocebus cupreus]